MCTLKGQLADTDQAIDKRQVVAHAARQRRHRQVIPAGVGVRVQTFIAQAIDGRHQPARGTRGVVSAQHPHHGGDTGQGEA